jgi:hypothetical protein
MDESSVLEYLMNNACPSIAFRIKKEILKETISPIEKTRYFSEIIKSPRIISILEIQHEDGYFGDRFHTPPSNSKIWSCEGCVRYLLEMGLDTSYQPLKQALDSLLKDDWRKECVGKAADIFGADNIRTSLFAQAGYENYQFMKYWIEVAIQGFRYIYEANSIDEIIVPFKDKQVFVEGKYLPIIYHLRTLAFTYSWRTQENMDIIFEALTKLYKWLPITYLYKI